MSERSEGLTTNYSAYQYRMNTTRRYAKWRVQLLQTVQEHGEANNHDHLSGQVVL